MSNTCAWCQLIMYIFNIVNALYLVTSRAWWTMDKGDDGDSEKAGDQ